MHPTLSAGFARFARFLPLFLLTSTALLPELGLLGSSWEGRVNEKQRGRNYAEDTAWVPGGAFQALKTEVAQVRCALGSVHHHLSSSSGHHADSPCFSPDYGLRYAEWLDWTHAGLDTLTTGDPSRPSRRLPTTTPGACSQLLKWPLLRLVSMLFLVGSGWLEVGQR